MFYGSPQLFGLIPCRFTHQCCMLRFSTQAQLLTAMQLNPITNQSCHCPSPLSEVNVLSRRRSVNQTIGSCSFIVCFSGLNRPTCDSTFILGSSRLVLTQTDRSHKFQLFILTRPSISPCCLQRDDWLMEMRLNAFFFFVRFFFFFYLFHQAKLMSEPLNMNPKANRLCKADADPFFTRFPTCYWVS